MIGLDMYESEINPKGNDSLLDIVVVKIPHRHLDMELNQSMKPLLQKENELIFSF